jgi:hypothetical protein
MEAESRMHSGVKQTFTRLAYGRGEIVCRHLVRATSRGRNRCQGPRRRRSDGLRQRGLLLARVEFVLRGSEEADEDRRHEQQRNNERKEDLCQRRRRFLIIGARRIRRCSLSFWRGAFRQQRGPFCTGKSASAPSTRPECECLPLSVDCRGGRSAMVVKKRGTRASVRCGVWLDERPA